MGDDLVGGGLDGFVESLERATHATCSRVCARLSVFDVGLRVAVACCAVEAWAASV